MTTIDLVLRVLLLLVYVPLLYTLWTLIVALRELHAEGEESDRRDAE